MRTFATAQLAIVKLTSNWSSNYRWSLWRSAE